MMKMGTSLNIGQARKTSSKAKGNDRQIGDGAIKHFAYGFVDRDVTMTGGSSL